MTTPAPKKPGHVLRVSPTVWRHLLLRKRKKESVDGMMRRLLGLPSRKGKVQNLRVFWALPKLGVITETEEDARGLAVVVKVQKKLSEIEDPICVRELR